MKKTLNYLLILMIILLSSCSINEKIDGLWWIEKVSIGTEVMTPVARWTRLHSDNTQESGNGWIQHSIGSWEFNEENNQIQLFNSNGLKDEFGGFTISHLEKERMLWTREEEDQQVTVALKKVDKIPQAPANKLFGVWKLKVNEEGLSEGSMSYLFFRWDQILIDGKADRDRKYGMYKTHGHKPELQIIYYEDPLRQELWHYEFREGHTLFLSGTHQGVEVKLEYERINYLPQ